MCIRDSLQLPPPRVAGGLANQENTDGEEDKSNNNKR